MKDVIDDLPKPIAILGANGFLGKNMANYLRKHGVEPLLAYRNNLWDILAQKPQTVFNFIAYGNHSFEQDTGLIYQTNFDLVREILNLLKAQKFKAFVNAGSSAEYGIRSYGASEEESLRPNTHYAASKSSASNYLYYMGKHAGLPVSHLRLFAVYGNHDYEYKLIPSLVRYGLERKWPAYLKEEIRRDFIHVDDVCEAFVRAAFIPKECYGNSFNIGTGKQTSMKELAAIIKEVFDIDEPPRFSQDMNEWDCVGSVANIERAKVVFGFNPQISLKEGLEDLAKWEGQYAEFVS